MSQQAARNSFASEGDSGYSEETSSDIGQEIACPNCNYKIPHRDRSHRVNNKDRTVRNKINNKLIGRDIHNISSDVAPVWKNLGRELGFEETAIHSFAERESDRERAIAMLTEFMQREGKKATRGRLITALKDEKVGRQDIVEKLQKLWGEEDEGPHNNITLQKIFTFTEENVTSVICQDNETKQSFLLYPIDESELDRLSIACKCLFKDAKRFLQSFDHGNSIEPENKATDLEENLAKLQELKDELQEVQDFQSRQDHHEDYAIVPGEVKSCARLVQKLQNNCTKLLRLTPAACRLENPLDMKSEMYNHSINLSLSQKDLEERILWLKEKALRNPEMIDEVKELERILNQCQMLRKEINMRQRFCHSLLQNEYTEPKVRTQSEPVQRSSAPTEVSWRPNSSLIETSLLQHESTEPKVRTQSEPVQRSTAAAEASWRPNSSQLIETILMETMDSSLEAREATAVQTAQQARPEEINESEL